MQMAIQIGAVRLPLGLFLAPMAGYTDRAMRQICREMGAEFTVTEMVSAKALCYGDRKSAPLARLLPQELPAAVQLFGSEPDILAEAARKIADGETGGAIPTAIDLNFGCPVRKITGNGEGSALMKDPRQICRIVTAVVSAVSLPVTVKLRAGWDDTQKNAAECARAAVEGGCSAVFLHGRTRDMMYSGHADRSVIREVCRAVPVPVIGNGDIRDAASARRMLDETGCAGLMVGRGAVGNPFVFREITAALLGLPYSPPTVSERIVLALRQLTLSVSDKGEKMAIPESRKQIAAYISGIRGAAALRNRINTAGTEAEIREVLGELYTGNACTKCTK